nr:hypothetical protein CFP56_00016 [Quercus suber]
MNIRFRDFGSGESVSESKLQAAGISVQNGVFCDLGRQKFLRTWLDSNGVTENRNDRGGVVMVDRGGAMVCGSGWYRARYVADQGGAEVVYQWVVVVLLMVDWGGVMVCGLVSGDWKVFDLGGGCIVDGGSVGGGFVDDGGSVGGFVVDG